MKKAKSTSDDELRPEYQRSDFRKLERGKYFDRVKVSSNVVIVDDEMTSVFPNSAAVNRALRTLVEVAQKTTSLTKRSRRRTKTGRR